MRLVFLVAIAVMLGGGPARGQNLLQNPGFELDLGGWFEASPGVVEDTWDPMDIDDSPTSGSLRQENFNDDGSAASGVRQCVAVMVGQAYVYGGSTYVPSGQLPEGRAAISIQWHDAVDCTGSGIGSRFGFGGTNALFDDWFHFESDPLLAPEGARALEMRLVCRKRDAVGTFFAFWDELFVLPEPSSGLLGGAALIALAVLARARRSSLRRPGVRSRVATRA